MVIGLIALTLAVGYGSVSHTYVVRMKDNVTPAAPPQRRFTRESDADRELVSSYALFLVQSAALATAIEDFAGAFGT
ncbi:hypothetical protein ADL21_20705 [Streptomyces albus subsp. albus]|nr:hypothetical protein ADL21_20705 [Streptomyces albus subsp. albus]